MYKINKITVLKYVLNYCKIVLATPFFISFMNLLGLILLYTIIFIYY